MIIAEYRFDRRANIKRQDRVLGNTEERQEPALFLPHNARERIPSLKHITANCLITVRAVTTGLASHRLQNSAWFRLVKER